MKKLLFSLMVVFSLAPMAFAASDCEKVCCRQWNATWNDNSDNCLSPKAGYDKCVSDCDARAIASGPQGPGPIPPENVHTCKVGFILPAVLAAAFILRKG